MNKKLALIAMVIAVVMSAVFPLVGTGPVAEAAPPPFTKPGFQRVWLTTDSQVDNGQVQRSYLWGPNFIDAGYERYDDAAPIGGQRRWVQYFDKTRMELNNPFGNPTSQYYVTNGLLVVELVSGRRQEGDARFVDTSSPANNVPVAGDNFAVNPNAPTYKTLRAVASYDDGTVAANRKANRNGQKVSETLTKDADGNGVVGNNAGLANYPGTNIVYYDNTLGHNIPSVLWDYMNQIGPKFDTGNRTPVNGQKVFDWLYAMGFPITDAYWTRVKVAGGEQDVLMQCFQRRCLTYTPSNPDGYKVEMGNVGQHYFVWRYGGGKMPPSQPINAPLLSPLKVANLSYGINAHMFYQNREQITGWVQDLGARWVRQQITWSDIEDPSRDDADRFVWNELDKIVESLYTQNIHIILNPVGTPAKYKSGGSGLPDSDKMNKFGEFMFALSNRYKGKVEAYEVWNEMNLSRESGTGINVNRYVPMLAKAYNSIKTADPAAIVMFGALSPTETNDADYAVPDTQYLKDIYAYNNGEIRNYFDVMGMHPGGQANAPQYLFPENPGPSPAWNNSSEFYFRRIETLRKVMEDAGDGAKQVWLTEFGWSSDSNPQDGYDYAKLNSPQQQADYIRGAYQLAQDKYPWMGVMALWNLNFSLVTNPTANGKNDEKLGFAILNRDGSKRPAYFAYQQLAKAAK